MRDTFAPGWVCLDVLSGEDTYTLAVYPSHTIVGIEARPAGATGLPASVKCQVLRDLGPHSKAVYPKEDFQDIVEALAS